MRCALPVLALVFAAVCLASPPSAFTQPTATPWGASNGTLSTRLTSDKASYTIDEPIRITLEVRNDSGAAQPFAPPDLIREDSLLIRRDGEPVRYIAGVFSTGGMTSPLEPGDTRRAEEPRLNEFWDFRAPGRYTIQFPETGMPTAFVGPFTEEQIKALRRVLPASNVLEIEVKLPPDGKVPPLDLRNHVAVFSKPAGKQVAPWRGIATSINWFELEGSRDTAVSVFAFARDGEPWPVHDGDQVALVVRMPEGRSADELTVDTAELDGAMLRLQVHRREVAGDSERSHAFALVPLERLLAPGNYTCDVRLVTERPEATKPEVDGYRFEFTVLPGKALGRRHGRSTVSPYAVPIS